MIDFMKNMHGFGACAEGILRVETIRNSERACKLAVLQLAGFMVMCDDESCGCVDEHFKNLMDTSKIEIVPVVISQGEHANA